MSELRNISLSIEDRREIALRGFLHAEKGVQTSLLDIF